MKRVLIVDEENISVRGIKKLFESRIPNAAAFVSKTCSAALKELDVNKYDLVILDMMLPRGDWPISIERPDNLYGIDLLAEIRKLFPSLPIICYTVLDTDSIREKITVLKADYLCKNHYNSRSELISIINKRLKN